MKKKLLAVLCAGFITGILCLGISLSLPGNARAAAKNNISCSVKNGTLTLSGKGAFTSSRIKVKNKDRIKKIVVKQGITQIPSGAFYEFTNVKEVVITGSVKKIGEGALPSGKALKKVTMPGTFRFVADDGDMTIYELTWNRKNKIDTVCFNTPLSLETLTYIKSRNLIVSKQDKKYKSIDGVIYSKDGKSIVRVPAYRETLTVEKGCEEFCPICVMYAEQDAEGDEYLVCRELKKIVLPDSIKTVNASKYGGYRSKQASPWDYSKVTELTINTTQLDSKSIILLMNDFQSVGKERILKQFDHVSVSEGMCINTRDNCFLHYTGTADEVLVPEGVKSIGENAFRGTKIRRAELPDTVTEIGKAAFKDCKSLEEIRMPAVMTSMGEEVFGSCEHLDHVTFPGGMTVVPKGTFEYCRALKEVTLPDTVNTIGESAFSYTTVPASILLQGTIKEIRYEAFSGTGWNEAVLPATVEKAESYVFPTLKQVRVCGSTAGIAPNAFCSEFGWKDLENSTLTFEKGVEEWQTGLMPGTKFGSKVNFRWQKVAGADGWQIEVSPDKAFRKKKTYYAKKGETRMKLTEHKMKINYVRIRPYQKINGKKSYGRWTTDTWKD